MTGLDPDDLQLELADEPAGAVGTLIQEALAAALLADGDGEVERAAGHDTTVGHDELHHYWTPR